MRMLSMNDNFFSDFDRMVDALVMPKYARTVGFKPGCDISETKEHYLLSFDVPGIKKEDLKIEVHNNQLMISGERLRDVSERSEKSMLHSEKVYGKFERTFELPTSVIADRIEASYEDGVLNIALPKAESAKARTIQIQTEKGFFGKLLSSKKEGQKEFKDVKGS